MFNPPYRSPLLHSLYAFLEALSSSAKYSNISTSVARQRLRVMSEITRQRSSEDSNHLTGLLCIGLRPTSNSCQCSSGNSAESNRVFRPGVTRLPRTSIFPTFLKAVKCLLLLPQKQALTASFFIEPHPKTQFLGIEPRNWDGLRSAEGQMSLASNSTGQ